MDEPEEKRVPHEAAQHLANLLGTSVAGHLPESIGDVTYSSLLSFGKLLPNLNLDVELFRNNNVGLAALVVLAALIMDEKSQRDHIVQSIGSEHFWPKSFELHLFQRLLSYFAEHNDITSFDFSKMISDYGLEVWGEPSNEQSLLGKYFKLAQIINLAPTATQVERAIELRRIWLNTKRKHQRT
jgi:hypothetical protein